MLNEQLARMTLYSHIDQPGLSWRTRAHGVNMEKDRKIADSRPDYRSLVTQQHG